MSIEEGKKEEDGQIVSLGDSRKERVRCRLAILSMLKEPPPAAPERLMLASVDSTSVTGGSGWC